MSTDFFVHEKGICESTQVGPGTKIWAFAHVLPGAKIGRDANICDGVFIENDVVLGDRVTVKCGVQLWDGVTLEDDVFVGPNATFTNDPFPRSKQYPESFPRTLVRAHASIGGNATILPGIEIGEYAMVGAGAVVTENVPPHAVVVGNPARIIRYTESSTLPSSEVLVPHKEMFSGTSLDLTVTNGTTPAALYKIPFFMDMRGKLTPIEFTKDLPFVPQRHFLVYGVANHKVRGEHAHKECHQFLMAVHGSLHVVINDGTHSQEVVLDSPHYGLHIPPRIWGIQYKFSQDAVLSVYASHPYDAHEYIRDFQEFKRLVGAHA